MSTEKIASKWVLVAASSALLSCQVLSTADDEGVQGRGQGAFDPYGDKSGAVRLALQMVNGCAVLATGEPVGRGSAKFFDYPATCPRDPLQPPLPANAPPAPPMEVLAGTKYFLNHFTLVEYVKDLHTNPANLREATDWLRSDERLRGLDWSNLSTNADEWLPALTTYAPGYYLHRVVFGGANWMTRKDDNFLVEVLAPDGTVKSTASYARADFLATDPSYAHTWVTWEHDNIGAPQFPGDLVPRTPPPVPVGGFANPATTTTRARLDFHGALHPEKQIQVPEGLTGDGAIRLTWSQLPDRPFYFPVRYVDRKDVPANCFKAEDPTQKVPCQFGVNPQVTFVKPRMGNFYAPGETVQFKLSALDGKGNFIHNPEFFPSWNEHVFNRANGLLYLHPLASNSTLEKDAITNWNVAGPRQLMRPYYELNQSPYYQSPSDVYVAGSRYGNDSGDTLVPPSAIFNFVPGGRDFHPSTYVNLTLPEDAKPGTYVVQWKVNRFFLGERVVKMATAEFQVGQAERTLYPGRIGNCQICHRGPASLENNTLAHGSSLDEVEGCTACHKRDLLLGSNEAILTYQLHARHMNSSSFTQSKADCSVCHLTRESALRPSLFVCASCHPQPHGTKYREMSLAPFNVLNPAQSMFSNCAQSCHGDKPPLRHILPP
jgi:hypothetical protein